MTDCQDGRLTFQPFRSIDDQCPKLSFLDFKIGDLCFKTHVSSKTQDLFSDIFNDFPEKIGSDVWFVQPQDFFRCTEFHKGFQYKRISSGGIFYGCIQFSIRKSAGSAFSELDIASFIQLPCLPECFNHLLSAVDIHASL